LREKGVQGLLNQEAGYSGWTDQRLQGVGLTGFAKVNKKTATGKGKKEGENRTIGYTHVRGGHKKGYYVQMLGGKCSKLLGPKINHSGNKGEGGRNKKAQGTQCRQSAKRRCITFRPQR